MVCIVRNAEIRSIKYYYATYALFTQLKNIQRNCAKIIFFSDWKTIHFNMD